METAGIIGIALIGMVIAFQIGLVAGAPWGTAAWGGQHPGTLPPRLRIASVVAILILAFLGWILATAAGLVDASPLPARWLEPAMWVMTGYFAIGAVVNLISRSPIERIWSPVSLLTAICSAIVALG